MGLIVPGVLRDLPLRNLPRQQHAAGLAADGPAADHPLPQRKVILRAEVLLHQRLEPAVLGHGAADDLLLGIPGEHALGELQLGEGEEAVVAVEILILPRLGKSLLNLVEATHPNAVGDCGKLPGIPPHAVREEHLLRVAVPHLHRVQVQLLFIGIDVQQQLCGVPDSGDGVEGMPATNQREVGHGVQLKQVRAGHAEEIAHHEVGVPHGLQLGQAVEHIERVPALPGDLLVNGHREGLEALVRVEARDVNAAQIPEHRFMLGKANVNHIPTVGNRLTCEGLRKCAKFLQLRNLPDHVVTETHVVQRFIQPDYAALDFVKGTHLSSLHKKQGNEAIKPHCPVGNFMITQLPPEIKDCLRRLASHSILRALPSANGGFYGGGDCRTGKRRPPERPQGRL